MPAKSTELQRERRTRPGGESGAPVAAVAPRADADIPAVGAGVGETLPLCAALHPGQRCVLVSHLCLNFTFAPPPPPPAMSRNTALVDRWHETT